MAHSLSVGFIGLGEQGRPMAQRIAAAGYNLMIWARRPETAASFSSPAIVCDSPAKLAHDVELLCICVTGDEDVREVLITSGAVKAMKPGSILAIHSTIRPETCVALASEVAAAGVEVVDAPVSGSAPRAAAGKLLLMAGASNEAMARVRPVFATYADPIFHIGPVGSGMRAKLVNNFLAAAHIGLAHATTELGEALGVEREMMRQVLMAGAASSYALENMPRLLPPRGAHVGRLLAKDCALAREALAAHSLDFALLDAPAAAAVDSLLKNQ